MLEKKIDMIDYR